MLLFWCDLVETLVDITREGGEVLAPTDDEFGEGACFGRIHTFVTLGGRL